MAVANPDLKFIDTDPNDKHWADNKTDQRVATPAGPTKDMLTGEVLNPDGSKYVPPGSRQSAPKPDQKPATVKEVVVPEGFRDYHNHDYRGATVYQSLGSDQAPKVGPQVRERTVQAPQSSALIPVLVGVIAVCLVGLLLLVGISITRGSSAIPTAVATSANTAAAATTPPPAAGTVPFHTGTVVGLGGQMIDGFTADETLKILDHDKVFDPTCACMVKVAETPPPAPPPPKNPKVPKVPKGPPAVGGECIPYAMINGKGAIANPTGLGQVLIFVTTAADARCLKGARRICGVCEDWIRGVGDRGPVRGPAAKVKGPQALAYVVPSGTTIMMPRHLAGPVASCDTVGVEREYPNDGPAQSWGLAPL